jgi:O-antigen ligase
MPEFPPDKRKRYAGTCLALMRAGLMFYVLLFPLGIALREIGSVWVTVSLLAYYALDFRDSNLARYPLKWLYAAFLALIVFKTLHTIHFSLSWYALSHNIYKGPMLFLGALEFMRRGRDAKLLAGLFAVMTFYYGTAGMVEYAEQGFIANKRFGNMMSLALPMVLAAPIILRRSGAAVRWIVPLAVALPGVMYWAAAQARSGWIGLAAACAAFAWIRLGTKRTAIIFGIAALIILALSPPRMNIEAIASDARWGIWSVAVDIFKEYPLLGTGINTFEPAYESIGKSFDPARYDLPVPHPHNIYLQFLYETGLIGFVIFAAFFFGQLVHAIRVIRRKATRFPDPWLAAATFWCASVGYAVTALSAHNFFRTWWLGLAMTVLGAAVGAAVCIRREAAQKRGGGA